MLSVPVFLCKNGKIVTDGANIIDSYTIIAQSVTNATSNSKRKRRQTSASLETLRENLKICCNMPDEVRKSFL